jgi:hypothetical protein
MRRRFVVAGGVPALYPLTVEARMAATGGGDGLVVKAPTMMVAQNRLPL